MKVFIADKDIRRGHSLKASLISPNAEIEVFTDGPAFLRDTAKFEGSTVVVWLSLGQMGGFAVCKELSRLDKPPAQTLLVIEREADSWLAAQCGADKVIVCPDSIAPLVDALNG